MRVEEYGPASERKALGETERKDEARSLQLSMGGTLLILLLAFGAAVAAGVPLLRVDCWAGAPGLVGFYEAQGFVRDAGSFDVRGWIGQVFSMRLGHQPGTRSR